jgi:hypothetical protein
MQNRAKVRAGKFQCLRKVFFRLRGRRSLLRGCVACACGHAANRVCSPHVREPSCFVVCANREPCWKQAKEGSTKQASSTCSFQIYNDPVPGRAVGPAKAKTSGPKTRKSGQEGNSYSASGEQTASHAPDAGEVGDGGWEVLSVSASPDPSCDSKLSHVDECKPADEVATNPLVQADGEAEADTAKVEEVEASKNDEPSAAALDETLEMEEVEELTEQPPEGQTVLASRLCFMSDLSLQESLFLP